MISKKGETLPEVPKIDEFIFILLAGVVLIFVLMIAWTTPPQLVPIVEPRNVEIDVRQGAATTFDLTFNGTATSVNLTAGGAIRNWLSFSKNNFDFRGLTTVKVTVDVPDNIPIGTYKGTIEVKAPGGEKAVSVTINVVETTEEISMRPISLGDFTVRYTEGSDVLDSKSSVQVVKGYFTTKEVTLVGILSNDKLDIATDGYIQLIVEETNSAGNLIVFFNDEKVFDQSVGLGESIIPIDKDLIKRSNSVIIKAGSPGFKFWMNTIYKFRFAKLIIDYKGVFSKEIPFDLTSKEIQNFKDFHLSYTVVPEPTLPLPSMMIKINNQIVFWELPPLTIFDERLKEDMLDNALFLREANNTITFQFGSEASYSVDNVLLTVEYYT